MMTYRRGGRHVVSTVSTELDANWTTDDRGNNIGNVLI